MIEAVLIVIRRDKGRKDREEADQECSEEEGDEKSVIIRTSEGGDERYLQIFSALISVIFQDVFGKMPIFVR